MMANECADHELGSDLRICTSTDRSDPPGTVETAPPHFRGAETKLYFVYISIQRLNK